MVPVSHRDVPAAERHSFMTCQASPFTLVGVRVDIPDVVPAQQQQQQHHRRIGVPKRYSGGDRATSRPSKKDGKFGGLESSNSKNGTKRVMLTARPVLLRSRRHHNYRCTERLPLDNAHSSGFRNDTRKHIPVIAVWLLNKLFTWCDRAVSGV